MNNGRTWEYNEKALKREKKEDRTKKIVRIGLIIAAFVAGALIF